MDRRKFLLTSTGVTLATAAGMAAATNTATAATKANNPAAPASASPTATPTVPGDPLNPPGIQTAGIRMLPVHNGQYKVWTKRLGQGPVKVLLLHGGPGFSHEYLEAMESFLPQAGIEMYYYDQLGCNNSDQPDDPSLWNLERYVEEVEAVRKGLGLDNFVLYGHSWGGILGIEYALKYPTTPARPGDFQHDRRDQILSRTHGVVEAAVAAEVAGHTAGPRGEAGL